MSLVVVYTYDAENRLMQVQEFTFGNPTPVATSTYRYDGLGRRIEKVGNGLMRRYIYDGEDILLEYDQTNALLARYTHGPGIDEPLAMTRGGSTFFYHQDGLGTVTELTDSTGTTAKAYAYDAYGNIVEQTGTVENPYTYTGREFDAETGLYYYRARYYDPSIGRFLQKDPIGFSGGDVNFYAYVGNNPARWIDPQGLFYPGDFIGGLSDMIGGYADMIDADMRGADAYFHCRANCEASRRGLGGYHAAKIASALREMIQNEPPADRARDEAANAQGQCAGKDNPTADCYKECANLIPPSGIPQRHLPPNADPSHRYQPAGTTP